MRFNANAREIYRDAEEIYRCAQVARRNKEYAYIMRLAGVLPTENQAPESRGISPLQISENERPRKAKTTFETFWNISNVISLISNVIFGLSGSFFEKWWMPSQITGEKAIFFGQQSYPSGAGY